MGWSFEGAYFSAFTPCLHSEGQRYQFGERGAVNTVGLIIKIKKAQAYSNTLTFKTQSGFPESPMEAFTAIKTAKGLLGLIHGTWVRTHLTVSCVQERFQKHFGIHPFCLACICSWPFPYANHTNRFAHKIHQHSPSHTPGIRTQAKVYASHAS